MASNLVSDEVRTEARCLASVGLYFSSAGHFPTMNWHAVGALAKKTTTTDTSQFMYPKGEPTNVLARIVRDNLVNRADAQQLVVQPGTQCSICQDEVVPNNDREVAAINTNKPTPTQCVVTTDGCQAVVQLPCKHLFHRECLEKNTAANKSKCPNCRARYSERKEVQSIIAPELQGSEHESLTASQITALEAKWEELSGTECEEEMYGWVFGGTTRQGGIRQGDVDRYVKVPPFHSEKIRSLKALKQRLRHLSGANNAVQSGCSPLHRRTPIKPTASSKAHKTDATNPAKSSTNRSGIDLSKFDSDTKSGFKYVYPTSKSGHTGRWAARICDKTNKLRTLGTFNTAEQAATRVAQEFAEQGREPPQRNKSHRSTAHETALVLEKSAKSNCSYKEVHFKAPEHDRNKAPLQRGGRTLRT